jgi:cohesin complex subunit SA-1/2
MDDSSVSVESHPGALRRRSGRVTKRPDTYAPGSPTSSVKRKRANDDDDVEVEIMLDEEDEGLDETDGEPDEEEQREKRRKTPKPKKPTSKKPKTNGVDVNLPIRPANRKVRRPKIAKTLKDAAAADEAGGLYGGLCCVAVRFRLETDVLGTCS